MCDRPFQIPSHHTYPGLLRLHILCFFTLPPFVVAKLVAFISECFYPSGRTTVTGAGTSSQFHLRVLSVPLLHHSLETSPRDFLKRRDNPLMSTMNKYKTLYLWWLRPCLRCLSLCVPWYFPVPGKYGPVLYGAPITDIVSQHHPGPQNHPAPPTTSPHQPTPPSTTQHHVLC